MNRKAILITLALSISSAILYDFVVKPKLVEKLK